MVGARSLKVTAAIETTPATGANTQCHAWLCVTQYCTQYSLQNTHTCTLNWTAAGREGGKARGRMEDGSKVSVGEGGSKGRE